jgi:hypothetical protein
MANIFLPKKDAPSRWPNVIQVNGVCYSLFNENSDETPDTEWDDVDATFDTCGECLFSCEYEWSVEYNCETEEWSTPTLENVDCTTSSVCAETNGWIFDNFDEETGICTYVNVECVVMECEVAGDCGMGSAPAVPGNPFDCPCPQPSSSSSSALSSSSSSSSQPPLPSSSASPPGPQPDEDRFI